MKSRFLLIAALLGPAAWLFLTDNGRKQRTQVRRLLGLAPGGADTSDDTWPPSADAPASGAQREPLSFPSSPAAENDQGPASGASASPAPAATSNETSTPSEPQGSSTPDQDGVTPPSSSPSSDQPAPSASVAPSPDQENAASSPDAPSTPADQDAETEANPRLEEVLELLQEEMETRAIGQEPDVKVEETLDHETLEEIGIPETEQQSGTTGTA